MNVPARRATKPKPLGARTLAAASAASLLLHGAVLAAAHWFWAEATPIALPPMTAVPVIDAASLQPPGRGTPAPTSDANAGPEAKPSPSKMGTKAGPPKPPPEAQPEVRAPANAKAETQRAGRARPAWTERPPLPPRRPRRLLERAEADGGPAPRPKPRTPDPRLAAPALAKSAPVTPDLSAGATVKTRAQTAGLPDTNASPARPVTGLGNPAPRYPWISRQRGVEGRVVLDVEVTAAGRAGAVLVKRTSGSARLDRAALEAVKTWRFSPARRAGRAVAARIEVPITFRLTD